MGAEKPSFCELIATLSQPIHAAQEEWLRVFPDVHWIIDHEGVLLPFGYTVAQRADRSDDSSYAAFSSQMHSDECVDRLPVNTLFLAALASAHRTSSQPTHLHFGLGSSVDATSPKAVQSPGNRFIIAAHARVADLITRHMERECEPLVPERGFTPYSLLVFPNDLGRHGARFLVEYIARKQSIDTLMGVVVPMNRFILPCDEYTTRLLALCSGLGQIRPAPLAHLLD